MRTKTLLLTAVLSAAAIATSVAQTVYSVNAVGYVNVTVPANGFAMLANPLNQPTNSLAAVLPDVPNNTVVYKYDPANGFSVFTKRATGWTGTGAATATLNTGEGFFIKNAGTTPMQITFVGEVDQGTNLTVSLPVGLSLISSKVPQAGKITTDLKLTPTANDKLYQWNPTTQAYIGPFTYRATGGGTWTGGTGEPTIGVAEGFFYQSVAATTWTRSFNVNQ